MTNRNPFQPERLGALFSAAAARAAIVSTVIYVLVLPMRLARRFELAGTAFGGESIPQSLETVCLLQARCNP